jgi:hypothetical protein
MSDFETAIFVVVVALMVTTLAATNKCMAWRSKSRAEGKC